MTLTFEPERGFGVYLHWPWCAKVCPYCDFNVYAAKARDVAPMVSAMIADLQGWRDKTGPRAVDTVFFGGGTPSLASPSDIEALVDAVDRLWGLSASAEISLEANPDDEARFGDVVAAGVNRLSLGVQSLDDAALGFLGRNHDAASARRAIATGLGLPAALSIDLIYALPDQSLGAWAAQLRSVLDFGAPHLSLYELTISEGTAFHRAVARDAWRPMDDGAAADLYDATQEITAAAGLAAYEISNHAGSQADRARHNLIYWRSGDWVGVGPGAHGRLTLEGRRIATEAERRPHDYVEAVAKDGVGAAETQILSAEEIAQERLIMGLRLVDGVKLADVTDLGAPINAAVQAELAKEGWLVEDAARIALTPRGRLLADHITTRLISR